jgi:hypothetical protein
MIDFIQTKKENSKGRADRGPVTRSRAQAQHENETKLNEIKSNFDHNSALVVEAVKLIK